MYLPNSDFKASIVEILVLDGKSKTKPGLKKFILQKIKTSLYKHFKYQL